MPTKEISTGTVHKLPADLRKILISAPEALAAWEDITPLARNEWICWVISPMLPGTRTRRLERTRDELIEGKRRPCCWVGCIHRTDKPISQSVQWVLDKRAKSNNK